MDIKRQGIFVFFLGALVGLAVAGIIGYITYPQDPTFEGSGGYHYLAMLLVYPVTSLAFGIAFYIGFRLKKRRK